MRWSLRTEGVCYQIVGIPKAASIPVNDSGLVSGKNMLKIAVSVWVWIRRRFICATENIQSLNQIQHWAVRFPHLIHRNLEVLVIWRNVSKPRCFVLFTGLGDLGGCKSPLWIWGRAMPIRWWVLADQHLLEIRLFFCLVELWEVFFFSGQRPAFPSSCHPKIGIEQMWPTRNCIIIASKSGDSVANGVSMCFCFFRKKVAPRDGNPPVRWSKAPVGWSLQAGPISARQPRIQYGIFMGKIWDLYGKNMGSLWEKYGIFMGKIWDLYGKNMGSLWEKYGIFMGKIWDLYGKNMGSLWEKYGIFMGKIWDLYGKNMGSLWEKYGIFMGKIWDLYGKNMGSLWEKYGIFMGKIWDLYGKNMGSLWEKYGIFMGKIWDLYGKNMGSLWEKYGIFMGKIWDLYGKNMGSLWEKYGIFMGKIWDLYGKNMGSLWEKYGIFMGKNMGSLWDIYGIFMGKNMGSLWDIYGKYMGYIWEIYGICSFPGWISNPTVVTLKVGQRLALQFSHKGVTV